MYNLKEVCLKVKGVYERFILDNVNQMTQVNHNIISHLSFKLITLVMEEVEAKVEVLETTRNLSVNYVTSLVILFTYAFKDLIYIFKVSQFHQQT